MNPEWKYEIVAQFEIADRILWLGYEKDPQTNEEIFSGGLDANDLPISFKKFVDEILGATFDLQLPSSLPDIQLTEFFARIVKDTSYHFEGGAEITLQNPLDLPNDYLSFSQLRFTLNKILPQPSEDPNDPPPPEPEQAIIVEADVNRSNQISWFPNASARLIFGDGARIVEMRVFAPLDPVQFIQEILDITLPPAMAQFIPTLSPLDAQDAPMRFYYANQDYTLPSIDNGGDSGDPNLSSNGSQSEPESSGGGNPAPASPPEPQYQQGLSLDQTVIEVLDQRFLMALDVHQGFTLQANMEVLDLGVFQLYYHPSHAPLPLAQGKGFTGPSLEVLRDSQNAQNDSISLHTRLNAFGEDFMIDLTYNQPCFNANVQFTDQLLGQSVGPLEVEWCKDKGFRIKNFPLPDALQKIIDLAELLKNLPAKGGCAAISHLLFEAFHIETNIHLNVQPKSALLQGKFLLILGGSWDMTINGHAITGIEFESAELSVDIPTSFEDLAKVIGKALIENVQVLYDALLNNTAKFAEVMLYITFVNLSQDAINSLLCRSKLPSVPNQVTNPPGEPPPPSVDPIAAAEGAATIAQAALAIPAVGALIAFLDSLLGLFGIKSSRQKRAERARDHAREVIRQRMAIHGLTASYIPASGNQGKQFAVSWDQIQDSDPNVIWEIQNAAPNKPTNPDESPSGDAQRFFQSGISKSQTSATVPTSGIINGVTNTISVRGKYTGPSGPITGHWTHFTIEPAVLQKPNPSHSYSPTGNGVNLDWQDIPSVYGVPATQYVMRIVRPGAFPFFPTTELRSVTISPSGNPARLHSQGFLPLDGLSLSPGTQYEFQVKALAQSPDLNGYFGQDPQRMTPLAAPSGLTQSYSLDTTLMTLRFTPVGNAVAYRVRIYDADTNQAVWTSNLLQPEPEDPQNPPQDGKRTLLIHASSFYRLATQNYHAYLQATGNDQLINSAFAPSTGPDTIRSGVGYDKIGITFNIG